jgi:radical SAM protein with 4Fe4S-binding SPASM domain
MSANCNYVPRGLLLQWHITNRCNLRCAHCYQEEYTGAELSLQDLLKVLQQFEELLVGWRTARPNMRIPGHITVTGGEPFVRPDFMDLLNEFHSRRDRFSFAVLTNGTLIDLNLARCLARLRPRFVQVSIEGTEETHDKIRGACNYVRVIEAVRNLRRAGVHTFISFTAHRANFREFPEVARLGRRLGVDRVWADRLIPSGSGTALDATLSPAETREFFTLIQQARDEATKAWFNRTQISAHRALQFLVCGGTPYHCTAGDTLLTVMPNGDLYPCRRMPVRVGNVFETHMWGLYYGAPMLKNLRMRGSVSAGCGNCLYERLCCGGLRCLSYAVHENPFRADPGCWVPDLPTVPVLYT